jgi:hypothetical protein
LNHHAKYQKFRNDDNELGERIRSRRRSRRRLVYRVFELGELLLEIRVVVADEKVMRIDDNLKRREGVIKRRARWGQILSQNLRDAASSPCELICR